MGDVALGPEGADAELGITVVETAAVVAAAAAEVAAEVAVRAARVEGRAAEWAVGGGTGS